MPKEEEDENVFSLLIEIRRRERERERKKNMISRLFSTGIDLCRTIGI